MMRSASVYLHRTRSGGSAARIPSMTSLASMTSSAVGRAGLAPALAFGPDGDARVAYRCQRDGVEQVHLARREPL